MILIIGAGLAGLSAAYHIKDGDYIIVEKESEAGGLCRSMKVGGFTFDYAGHLLHINDPYFSSFITEVFPGVFTGHERRSFIYSKGVYTPYPFQINTFGLPRDAVFECLYGFVKARICERNGFSSMTTGERYKKNKGRNAEKNVKEIKKARKAREAKEAKEETEAEREEELSFKRWILKKFGVGFANHFLFPFNEKMYCRNLEELSSEWTNWSIPVPSLQDVMAGAIGIKKTSVGYNKTFLYPVSGGIEVLANRLASKCRNLLLDSEIDSIDLLKKEAHLRNGGFIRYGTLISTIPLDGLLSISRNIPEEIAGFGKHLKYVKVMNINIGFEGKLKNDFHWIYFPECNLPFYRVGFPTNFSKGVAPEGYSSLYAEVSLRGEETPDMESMTEELLEALIRLKIIENEKKIVVRDVNMLDPAYVVFDFFRKNNIEKIATALEKMDVITAGRFGGWDYLPMEGAFLAGQRAASVVLKSR
ncbi:MAG: FAD-dependent oxidoreductase [Acidobacteriota bacterium]